MPSCSRPASDFSCSSPAHRLGRAAGVAARRRREQGAVELPAVPRRGRCHGVALRAGRRVAAAALAGCGRPDPGRGCAGRDLVPGRGVVPGWARAWPPRPRRRRSRAAVPARRRAVLSRPGRDRVRARDGGHRHPSAGRGARIAHVGSRELLWHLPLPCRRAGRALRDRLAGARLGAAVARRRLRHRGDRLLRLGRAHIGARPAARRRGDHRPDRFTQPRAVRAAACARPAPTAARWSPNRPPPPRSRPPRPGWRASSNTAA